MLSTIKLDKGDTTTSAVDYALFHVADVLYSIDAGLVIVANK